MKVIDYLKQNYWLAGILVMAAFLRIYHADYQSIWLDEIHTMIESDPSLTFREFDRVMVVREGMGHLYFLILRFLYAVVGYTTLTARLFSAFVGIASVYALYLFGRALFNKRAGLIAAALLSVNFFHITYSQEARPYILLVFFTIVSFYRLLIFIKNPTLKNALWHGVFSGLIINAHFVGLITVGSQYLLLLFILILTQKEQRKAFFRYSFYSGLLALLVTLPTYRLLLKMTKYNSGWLQLPGPDGFTSIFRDFMGGTEMLYFIFNLLIIFYLLKVFRQKEPGLSLRNISDNKYLFSALILFSWMFFSFPLSIIKSYLDEPMILSRYFIHLLPALMVTVALGIELIRNRIAKTLVITVIVVFALTDIFVVRKYYHTVTKTQWRDITAEIKQKNLQGDRVVSAYGWLMGYFFNKDKNDKATIEMHFDNYVAAMRNKAIPKKAFWYLDGNYRSYSLHPENEQFLEQHFVVVEVIEKHDTWARYYKPKESNPDPGIVDLSGFEPRNLDNNGFMGIYENNTVKSQDLHLTKGSYILVIEANSTPEQPIKDEHAHIRIILSDKELKSIYLRGNRNESRIEIPFEIVSDTKAPLEIIYDNDVLHEGIDRNVIIYSIEVIKKEQNQ